MIERLGVDRPCSQLRHPDRLGGNGYIGMPAALDDGERRFERDRTDQGCSIERDLPVRFSDDIIKQGGEITIESAYSAGRTYDWFIGMGFKYVTTEGNVSTYIKRGV